VGALVDSKVETGIEYTGIIAVRYRIERDENGADGGIRWVGLGSNQNVPAIIQPCCYEVARWIIEGEAIVFYLLEKGADGLIGNAAECAIPDIRRDIADVFITQAKITGPIEDIKCNVAKVIHCAD
jgi:hypothetical protein